MLFIIIVDNNQRMIKRLRRYLIKIIINTHIFKTVFEKQVRKKLIILKFINIYNYFINKINNANQLRCYYNI